MGAKSPFPSFKEHAFEVITWLRRNLDRAQMSKSESLRQSYFYQVDTGLRLLLFQYGIFKLVIGSSSDKRATALQNLVCYYSHLLGLKVVPLSFFGDSYYSSGSFPYYKHFSLRLKKEYYVLSVDHTDPPVFWPLALHELAHCWLSSRNDVDRVCHDHPSDLKGIDKDLVESRLEEAFCDVIEMLLQACFQLDPCQFL